jgi:hypothetical protein
METNQHRDPDKNPETYRENNAPGNESGLNTTSDDEKEMPEKHHQEHGNRKYKMFRNHSSADDQPRTDTGTP